MGDLKESKGLKMPLESFCTSYCTRFLNLTFWPPSLTMYNPVFWTSSVNWFHLREAQRHKGILLGSLSLVSLSWPHVLCTFYRILPSVVGFDREVLWLPDNTSWQEGIGLSFCLQMTKQKALGISTVRAAWIITRQKDKLGHSNYSCSIFRFWP